MIGTVMGDYTIIKSLGKGGFGSVWEAQSSDGHFVALKVLNPQVLENEKVVRKFFHEAMILAKLDHPNICRLLEFFPDGNNYCIVMEYVKGTELKKLMQQQKKLPYDLAFKIAKQSLEGFEYAHKSGILHRDIKPANIMVDKHGDSKIMDFGIAKMSTAASHDTAASMLSIFYVPPERLDKSREIDVRSDIYSLGLVFYEMFAGRRPFSATETAQVMFCHLNEIPEPPSKFDADIPPHISQAIVKSLEKDPDDRFDDFKAFSNALGGLDKEIDDDTYTVDLEEGTILVDGAPIPPAAPAVAAKKKAPMGMIAGIVGALIIAGAVGGYFATRPKVDNGKGPETTSTTVKDTDTKPGVLNAKGFSEIKHAQDASTMVIIPAGEFTMGSDKYSAEKPVQKIFLDQYAIDKYLVTNEQFQKFVDTSGYVTDAEKEGAGMVRIGRRWKKIPGTNWKMPDGFTAIEGREKHPVSQVSYNDALAYCKWAGKDLPTEAQWEKAARGPEGTEYPWGDSEPDNTMANFDNIVGTTTPVDNFDKGQSFYGLNDMGGNVYQWIKDWYGTGSRETKNPTGPASGKEHIIKGGSFVEGMESLRSANRDRYEPNYSSFLFGFRCAKSY